MNNIKKFNKFYFKSFDFDLCKKEAKFHYSFDNEVFFEELIDFSDNKFNLRKNIDTYIINNILFHIHIALWISYYKTFPTSELIVESGFLDDFQISFWKKFYINWLWEFFFTNNISPKWLFNFINASDKKYIKKEFNISSKALVPVWWWKDSIVSVELLKKWWIDFDLFTFWKVDELKKNTSKISTKNILNTKRNISKTLFLLNEKWYYNWHVPITWIIAFNMLLVSYLYDYKYLILSNEKSANFWNTTWGWIEINHQYSKSLDFEKDFCLYVEKYISSEIKYFSLLRWMYEYKIAELFSIYWKDYFKYFSSCNNNFKIFNISDNIKKWKYWCNNCPKCVFVFSILRPFLPVNEVLEIFGEDLFDRKDLEQLFKELLWISWIKPFECVWEKEEVILGLYKSIEKYDNNNLPFILNMFKNELINKNINLNFEKIEKKLCNISSEDIIAPEIKKLIFKDVINNEKK